MNGREQVERVLAGKSVERLPVLPILHAGLAPLFEVPLGEFFTRAETMAAVMTRGCREFGLDGVQLSMGVTGEAEALGARVDQPADGAPLLKERLLADLTHLEALRSLDPSRGGRMPLFFEAARQVVAEIGQEAFVLVTLRGPLLSAAQLRGVEQILIDLIDCPEEVERILDFTTELALRLGRWLLDAGAPGLAIGEATCSPNFISPNHYRRLVQPRHRALVAGLHAAGWQTVGLHICGDITAILEEIIATGVDYLDVDYQVPAERALALAGNRIALRGNLDPAAVLRFGSPEAVATQTRALADTIGGARWIVSGGCDIPPGTPAENLKALVAATRG